MLFRSNCLYLELLATTGVLGFLSFLTLLGVIGWRCLRLAMDLSTRTTAVWPLAGIGALVAFLAHGLLDSMLEPFAVMGNLWLILAMALSPGDSRP